MNLILSTFVACAILATYLCVVLTLFLDIYAY